MKQSSGKHITLLDGGMGRALSELGVSLDAPLWSARAFLNSPELIKQAHIDFIEAGSEVITTNSYALTDYYLNMAGLIEQKDALLAASYEIAHRARSEAGREGISIAASIPPLNESYRPDLLDPKQLEKEYPLLIQAAVRHGADILLGETLSSVAEAEAILRHSADFHTETWISFTVADNGDLRSGESLEHAVKLCAESGAQAVLLNCSTPAIIGRALDTVAKALEGSEVRFGAYANRFEQVRPDFTLKGGLNPINHGITCKAYGSNVKSWVDMGAEIVGGCCGFGPEYIRAIAVLLGKLA